MTIPEPFLGLGIALGLGLLVGLQRQHAGSAVAGVRTFALIAMLGASAGMLTAIAGPWVIAAGLLSVAALAWIGNQHRGDEGDGKPHGVTTEAAMLVVFVVGVLVMLGERPAAALIGAACAVLLHLKERLHKAARWLTADDVLAIMQFAAVTLIVLPILPDRDMGPYGALNPRQIWWMVVLVVGLSLAAYLVHRLVGGNRGTLVAGVLGGLISSTATTAAVSKSARSAPATAAAGAAAIAVAGTVLYPRIAIELAVVAPALWVKLAWPLGVMLVGAAVMAAVALLHAKRERTELEKLSNPTQLKGALLFAGIYAAVTLASAWASDTWGSAGMLAVAAVSGLTDMDAITLTAGKEAAAGAITPSYASAVVLVAAASNTLFKLGIIFVVGGRALAAHAWWFMTATAVLAGVLAAVLLMS